MQSINAVILALALLPAVGCTNLDTRSPQIPDLPFALVVLPDTQIYAWKHPDLFHAQTQWIADNVAPRNVRYVLHLGDVTQHNNDAEWTVAKEAFARIDGKVPYAMAAGNHDLGPQGSAGDRTSLMMKYFPVRHFKRWPTFGGIYDSQPDRPENSYHLFGGGGRKWLIVVLEFAPRDEVLDWANRIVAKHKDRWTIVITHAYLTPKGERFDKTVKGQGAAPHRYRIYGAGGNEGEQMWQKFISRHANIKLVISGHVCTAASSTDTGAAGNTVHQMLVDYQKSNRGGDGWLRILTFSEGGTVVDVQDYSPALDKKGDAPNTKFQFTLTDTPARAK